MKILYGFKNENYFEGLFPWQFDIITTQRPNIYYEYNFQTNEWFFSFKNKWLDEIIRPYRNQLLDYVDIKECNAERWELMTEETKQEWRNYKEALRTITKNIEYVEGKEIEDYFPKSPID